MRGERVRLWSKAAALAFGVAVCGVLALVAPLISSQHMLVYHFQGSAASLFLPVYVDLGALWLALTGLLALAGGARAQAAARTGLVLAIPWMLLKDWSLIRVENVPHGLSVGLAMLPFVGAAGAALYLRGAGGRETSRLLKLGVGVLGALALSGVVIAGQLTFCFWQARGLNDLRSAAGQAATRQTVGRGATGQTAAGQGSGGRVSLVALHGPRVPARVIVLLFDELSAAQLTRASDHGEELALPGFDALARESVVFTDVRPEGDQTDRAVPALLSGRRVDAVRASADGRRLELRGPEGWTEFSGAQTMFADALAAGYRTALSGWFNPYCRVLPEVLVKCDWHSPASLLDMGSERGSEMAESMQPVHRVLRAGQRFLLHGRPLVPDPWPAAEHLRDYRRITASADRMMAGSTLTFLFVHLPIPHQGGIYDRRKGIASGEATSYLDNLALADLYLTHVRKMLEARGEWRDSVVVAMGDHSWRTWMWEGGEYWTAEDARASDGGRFDDRPALMVKLAGEEEAGQVVSAFEGRETRGMLNGIMRGEIRTAAQLEEWAKEHGVTQSAEGVAGGAVGSAEAGNVKP